MPSPFSTAAQGIVTGANAGINDILEMLFKEQLRGQQEERLLHRQGEQSRLIQERSAAIEALKEEAKTRREAEEQRLLGGASGNLAYQMTQGRVIPAELPPPGVEAEQSLGIPERRVGLPFAEAYQQLSETERGALLGSGKLSEAILGQLDPTQRATKAAQLRQEYAKAKIDEENSVYAARNAKNAADEKEAKARIENSKARQEEIVTALHEMAVMNVKMTEPQKILGNLQQKEAGPGDVKQRFDTNYLRAIAAGAVKDPAINAQSAASILRLGDNLRERAVRAVAEMKQGRPISDPELRHWDPAKVEKLAMGTEGLIELLLGGRLGGGGTGAGTTPQQDPLGILK